MGDEARRPAGATGDEAGAGEVLAGAGGRGGGGCRPAGLLDLDREGEK